jgi:hypothetical protein
MYRVIVHKRMYLNETRSESVLLKRELQLPFVPFVGLSLVQGAWSSEPLAYVCWLVDDACFSCNTEPLVPDVSSEYSVSQLVEFHLADGWERNA